MLRGGSLRAPWSSGLPRAGSPFLRSSHFAPILALIALAVAPEAWADVSRLIDADGVLHVTNVSADPRYRAITEIVAEKPKRSTLSRAAHGLDANEIRKIASGHGVSAAIVEAVIRAESAFNPSAVSPKGARGLMQLMPKTAAALGVKDPFVPRENVEGGVRHLAYLLHRYAGNVALALAAYNAGERAVDTQRGIPRYPETQQYVARVMRWAGLDRGTGQDTPQSIYRYQSADGSMSYSNHPLTRREDVNR